MSFYTLHISQYSVWCRLSLEKIHYGARHAYTGQHVVRAKHRTSARHRCFISQRDNTAKNGFHIIMESDIGLSYISTMAYQSRDFYEFLSHWQVDINGIVKNISIQRGVKIIQIFTSLKLTTMSACIDFTLFWNWISYGISMWLGFPPTKPFTPNVTINLELDLTSNGLLAQWTHMTQQRGVWV